MGECVSGCPGGSGCPGVLADQGCLCVQVSLPATLVVQAKEEGSPPPTSGRKKVAARKPVSSGGEVGPPPVLVRPHDGPAYPLQVPQPSASAAKASTTKAKVRAGWAVTPLPPLLQAFKPSSSAAKANPFSGAALAALAALACAQKVCSRAGILWR